MQVFTYSFAWEFIYRYTNLIITPPLLIITLAFVSHVDRNPVFLIPIFITLLFLYILNKSYLEFYKMIPNRIEADDEKLVCSQFFFRRKTLTIYLKDVESLTGGMFSGKYHGVMKVSDGKNKIAIGFFDKINHSTKLISIILNKVDQNIYDDVVEKLKSMKIGSELKK